MTSTQRIRIAIVGDVHQGYDPRIHISEALSHSSSVLGLEVETHLIPSESLTQGVSFLSEFHGLWAAPGKYDRHDLGLEAIKYARIQQLPFIGTCAGFQYAVLEFALSHFQDSTLEHPYHVTQEDPNLIVTPLACAVPGQVKEIEISLLNPLTVSYYQLRQAKELSPCKYGINPKYLEALELAGLTVAAKDLDKEVRIVILPQHPFFLATLFMPQLKSSYESPHPLVSAFLKAASLAV